MILDTSFVVLQADQDKNCKHFPIFLHRISNMDTQMYNIKYAMFAVPNIFALYIRYILILTLCF